MIRILAVVFPKWDWNKYSISRVSNPARPAKRRISRKSKNMIPVTVPENEENDA